MNNETLLTNKYWRMNHLYKIKTKAATLSTLKYNNAQDDYWTNQSKKDVILKARQLGFSTECLLDLLDETITTPNINTAIIAHQQEKVMMLFEIVRLAWDHFPKQIKPKVSYDNRNELYFPEHNSKIYVSMDTRGETVHNLHVSEVAFIRDAEKRMPGILESVPKNGKIRFESTANGMSGLFYDTWMDNHSEFKKHFYNWLWDKEYTEITSRSLEQLHEDYRELSVRYGLISDIYTRFELSLEQYQWYISKARRLRRLIVQEYPTSPLEAFISLGRNVFDIRDLQKHEIEAPIERKWQDLLIWEMPLTGFNYIIGCDPSEGIGGDNATIEVLNAYTGEQAAEFATNHCQPDILAGYLIEIGRFYNNAFIVLEINNHGLAVLNAIKHKYANIYRRETFDKRTKEYVQSMGWKTTGTTKPLLIDTMEQSVREESVRIKSEELLKECKTFVRTDVVGKQGYGAEGSNKDDRVIAFGLAIQGIKHLPHMKAPKTEAQKRLDEYIREKQLETQFPGRDRMINIRNKARYKIKGINR